MALEEIVFAQSSTSPYGEEPESHADVQTSQENKITDFLKVAIASSTPPAYIFFF